MHLLRFPSRLPRSCRTAPRSLSALRVPVVVLVAVLAATAPPPVQAERSAETEALAPSDAEQREAVAAADRRLAQAVAERDEEAFRRLLAPDVLLLGATTERGRGAAVAAWGALFRTDGPKLEWEPEEVFVASAGDLALTVGSFRFTPAPADVAAEGSTGRYVTVWRHDRRGGWRVVVDGTLLEARSEAVVEAVEHLDVDGAGLDDPAALDAVVTTDTRPETVSASADLAWGLGTLTVRFDALLDGPVSARAPHLAVWTGSDRTDPAFEAVGTFRPGG